MNLYLSQVSDVHRERILALHVWVGLSGYGTAMAMRFALAGKRRIFKIPSSIS